MDIKDTMRKELAIILQIDNKADYNNKKYVRSVRNYIEEKNINGSAYGQRFEKQIKSIDENDNFTTENMSRVVCNKESSPKLICQACRDKLIGTSVRKQEEINKSQSSVNASETVSGIINEETKQTIKNTANAVSSGTKKTVDTITERVNVILGGEGKVDLRLRDLFSQVLKKHTKEEADELFICGTKYTTPAPDKISTAWPKPWLFSRVGALLIATFFILLLCCKSLDNGVVIPGIMFVGSMAIPFSMLIFLFEINAPRNISIFRVVSVFMLGGAAACFTAITLEKLSSTEKITVGVAVFIGVVEEIGKIIIMAYTMNKLKTTKYILNGMLVGGAIGAGVSVFESAGYAFGAYIGVKLFGMFSVQTVSSIDNMVANIFIRAFLSPGTHIAWSAMEGAFLVIVLAGEAFTWSALRSKKYITLCTIPVAMHAFWDMPVLDIEIGYFNIKMVALEILALIIILVILSRGLSQINDENNRIARIGQK